MGIACGIVGLPNIGKSTLFNAISKSDIAQSANYPFCTIEPNSAKIPLNDENLKALAAVAGSKKIVPNYLEIIDIAGLVKGASKGEGLGNKFLSHIREVDAVIHLVRCFEDGDITHVEHSVDPIRDIEIITTELVLADLEQVEKMMTKNEKKAKSGDKTAKEIYDICEIALATLNSGKMLNTIPDTTLQYEFKKMNFITYKPQIYVCNVKEEDIAKGNKFVDSVKEYAKKNNTKCLMICAKFEAEIAAIENDDERQAFLQSAGVDKSGLDAVTQLCFDMLKLRTFYTIGPNEAHAWTFPDGSKAPECAGIIHSDFRRGFIKAEVISTTDYLLHKGESGARESGKLRLEGKDYIVQNGDIINFKFNV